MKKCWAVCLAALAAEALAVTWRWGASPTDGLRVGYEGEFLTYFVDSLAPWLVIFTVLMLAWLLISKARNKSSD